jgi:hypothetical protein
MLNLLKGGYYMTLERFFYHKICGKGSQPVLYGKKVDEFPSIVDARNFIYETYKTNYYIDESDPMAISITSCDGVAGIRCFFNI